MKMPVGVFRPTNQYRTAVIPRPPEADDRGIREKMDAPIKYALERHHDVPFSVLAGRILFCLISFVLCLSLPALASDAMIDTLLPPESCSDGWVMEGKPAIFTKDNLFDYINGEAELYFPYGFDMLATARYVSTKNPAVSLVMDLYRMGSLTDAFGMYANYRRSDDIPVRAGSDAVLSPSQMLMYQDRYYVRLQASGAPEIEKNVFLACAGALSKRLPQNLRQPQELNAFGIPAVTPRSERYIAQSLLGYSFFRRGFTADAVVDGTPILLFIVPEDTQDAARKTFEQYRSYLAESGKDLKKTATGRTSLTAIDPLYGGAAVQLSGRHVIGAVRVPTPDAALKLLDLVRERLPR